MVTFDCILLLYVWLVLVQMTNKLCVFLDHLFWIRNIESLEYDDFWLHTFSFTVSSCQLSWGIKKGKKLKFYLSKLKKKKNNFFYWKLIA